MAVFHAPYTVRSTCKLNTRTAWKFKSRKIKMYMASVDYYSTGLLHHVDLALLARYLLYSCIRTGVQVLFSNNYFDQLPVWVKNLNL